MEVKVRVNSMWQHGGNTRINIPMAVHIDVHHNKPVNYTIDIYPCMYVPYHTCTRTSHDTTLWANDESFAMVNI
jgi:hypothetical protein